MEKFSPTRLETYRNCPRQFKFKYVDRVKVDKGTGVEALVGTCVHSAFEELYRARAHEKVLSEEETLAVFADAWTKGVQKEVTIRDAKYTLGDWRRVGEKCVRDYYRAHAPFDADTTLDVERRIGFALPVTDPASGDTVECRIEGFVDRLARGKDGCLEIHDYKTGGSLPTQAQKDKDWQLALYEVAAREAWPDTTGVRLIWHYVRHGQTIVSTRTPEQLTALKSEVARLIGAIEAEVARKDDPQAFKPVRGPLCDWCDYRDLCPLFKHAEDLDKLPPEERIWEPGSKLVDEYARLDHEKKALRAKLEELERQADEVAGRLLSYARAKGLLAVDGAEYAAEVHSKEELKFPTKTKSPQKVEQMESELKGTPVWAAVSRLDTRALLELYKSGRLSGAVLELVKRWLDQWGKSETHETVRLHKRRESRDE
ncbi:MAG: PD-(D/E)XK nuclease family protein [Elusimicrobia bacterium]|nr:PD-(D/E)XK nuclease family protein [Elusimicrobiota bacterium]